MGLNSAWEEIDHDVILPPSWAFGLLLGGYTSAVETVERVRWLRGEGIPVDAYWVDTSFWNRTGKGTAGYLNFRPDENWFPDPEGFFAALDAEGVRAGVWIWDRILRRENEEVFQEFARRGYFGRRAFVDEKDLGQGSSECGWIAFDNPAAAHHFMERLRPLFAMGLDFLKMDGSAHPGYVKAGFEATQTMGIHTKGRGFVLALAGPADQPAMKRYPVVRSADAVVGWDETGIEQGSSPGKGGLKQMVESVSNPAHPLYGWPFAGHDTGGFAHGTPSDELFMRWCQFSCFNPISVIFGAPYTRKSNFAQEYGTAAQENLRRYARLKLQLFPYIYSYAVLSRLTGRKMVRGNGMHLDQYQFGDEFIVAPVVEPGATERMVFLPRGTWIDYWTGAEYASPLGQSIPVLAPLDRLPLFVRSGSIIPMREEADSIARGSNDPLVLDIYPDAKSLFYLIEDDGTSNDYLADRMARTTIQCTETYYGRVDRSIRLSLRTSGDFAGFRPVRTIYAMIHGVEEVQELHATEDLLLPVGSLEELRKGASGYWIDQSRSVLWLKFHANTVRGCEVTVDC